MYGPDAYLGEAGKRQAEQIGDRIAAFGDEFDVAYTSPLERATTTVLLAAQSFLDADKEIFFMPGLADVTAPGWVGRMLDAPEYDGTGFYHSYKTERYDAVVRRVIDTIDTICTMERGTAVTVFSHRDPLLIARHFLEHPSDPVPPIEKLLDMYGDIDPGHAFRVTLDATGQWRETQLLSGSESEGQARRPEAHF